MRFDEKTLRQFYDNSVTLPHVWGGQFRPWAELSHHDRDAFETVLEVFFSMLCEGVIREITLIRQKRDDKLRRYRRMKVEFEECKKERDELREELLALKAKSAVEVAKLTQIAHRYRREASLLSEHARMFTEEMRKTVTHGIIADFGLNHDGS